MRKTLVTGMSVLLAVALAACGGTKSDSSSASSSTPKSNTATDSKGEKVKIIIANNKGELTAQYQEAAKQFMAANPNIDVDTQTGAVGDTLSALDRLTVSGETVTLAMIEPNDVFGKYKDFGIDLSEEKWAQETNDAVKDASGKIVGFPFSIEGFGLVYNKKVVEKAINGNFDPYSINSRDKLKDLLDKIKASGVKFPVAYQTEAWSVGNHYSSLFLDQAANPSTILAQLKEGKFDLAGNAVWNGYYDTMDLLSSKEYNKYSDRPLDKVYDDAHLSVGKGESVMLFNGNWAFDSLKAVAGDSFGFIPVPVDNNPNNPLNNKIAAGPTNIYLINKKATPAQQEAAKKYLNWLVYDQAGQDWLVNKAQVISAFKNNPNRVSNPLGAAIQEAISKGKTMPFSTNYITASDWVNIIGPEVQKYIVKKNSRADLAKAIQTYFTQK